jgi:release factor glutamine methyltransferase
LRNIRDIIQVDAARLVETLEIEAATARIEIQSLLQQVLGVARSYLLAHPEQRLNTVQQAAYDGLLHRRQQNEPIAYILGEREFFGLIFKTTPDTLIPRPDTELLVELALQRIPSPPLAGEDGHQAGKGCRVLDLGTGSGAIALSIAHMRPDTEVIAVDASAPALAVARENAQRLGITNASFLQSDWFAALHGQSFDLIVSNPPYIAAGDVHLKEGDVRFEPLSALVSGADGLDDIRRIVGQAGDFLENQGWLLLEHGYDQGGAVRDLLQQNGLSEVFSAKDIAGIERVSGGMIAR